MSREQPSVHAVIPAAGEGTRLGEITDERPKPLIEINGQSILEHVLDTAIDAGIDHAVVVIGYRGEDIIASLGDQYRELPITYVHQRERLGIAHAVEQAHDYVEGPFVVLNADNVFGASIAPAIDAVTAGSVDGALLVEEVSLEEASETGVIEVADGRITRIIEKPDDPPTTLTTTGCYVLPEDAFHACALVQAGETGERELSEAVGLLATAGYTLQPIEFDGWRVNVNTPADIERASSLLAGTAD